MPESREQATARHRARMRSKGSPMAFGHALGRALRGEVPESPLSVVLEWASPAPDGCLTWPGGRNEDGYGVTHAGGRKHFAHRLVYELIHGPIPAGEQIHHVCADRACVAPGHLQAVTLRENVAEMRTRRALEARISALEAELTALKNGDPTHA